MFTPQQCRMARAALELGVRDLAHIADVSPNTIARLEAGERMHRRTLDFVKGVLEAKGIIFIDQEAESLYGGAGIRVGPGPKSAYAAVFLAFDNVPDLRADPKGAYDALLGVMDSYLNIIALEAREPDAWERIDLIDALNSFRRSDVFGAQAYIKHAITPPDNQSKDYPLPHEMVEASAPFNLKYFRYQVSVLRAKGYLARC